MRQCERVNRSQHRQGSSLARTDAVKRSAYNGNLASKHAGGVVEVRSDLLRSLGHDGCRRCVLQFQRSKYNQGKTSRTLDHYLVDKKPAGKEKAARRLSD